MIYLDNNATTKPLPQVLAAMNEVQATCWGNASSPHLFGKQASDALTSARQTIAEFACGVASESRVHIAPSGSLGNLIVLDHILGATPKHIATSKMEHASVYRALENVHRQNHKVSTIGNCANGVVDLDELELFLSNGGNCVSLCWVNSVTGTIQPIEEVGRLCRQYGAKLHVDAVQAAGKLPISTATEWADYTVISAHKMHGPKGVAAVVFGTETDTELKGISSNIGTTSVALAVGFAEACRHFEEQMEECSSFVLNLRSEFESRLRYAVPDLLVNCDQVNRICNTSNVRFPINHGQALLAKAIQKGLCISQSSACTTGIPEPAKELLALGLTEQEAYASMRVSFSSQNDLKDVEQAIEILVESYESVVRFSKMMRESV